jgi:autotransporter-associated beta strand protein
LSMTLDFHQAPQKRSYFIKLRNSFLAFGLTLLIFQNAAATDSTWTGTGLNSSWNNAANWTGPAVPTNTATFSGPTPRLNPILTQAGTTINAISFAPGTPTYTFSTNGFSFSVNGAGVTNSSGANQNFTATGAGIFFDFFNSASAGTQTTYFINGGANLAFAGTATASSATFNNSSILSFAQGSTAGSANITNNIGGILTFADGSSAGTATIQNNATLQFITSPDASTAKVINTSTGTVDISFTNAGVNIGELSGAGAIHLGAKTLTTGGLNTPATISGVISDANLGGRLVKEGTADLTLSGNNTYQGDTTISGGSLTMTGDTSGLGGNIIDNATLIFDPAANTAFNHNISGTGAVIKNGPNTTNLNGANTWTGGTTINGGTINGLLPVNTDLTVNGPGSYTLQADTAIGSLAGAGAGTVNLQNFTLTTGASNTNTNYAGIITGTGNVTKDGTGDQTLAGNNTYTGNTTVTGGTVTFTGDTTALGGNIIDNSAVVFNQAADSAFNHVISGTGTLTKQNASNLTLAGNNTYTGDTTVTGGTLTFTGDTTALGGNIIDNSAVVFNQAADSAFNHVISGTGTVTKQNASNLTLAGNNTYTGNTTVTGGIVTFTGDTTALGGNIIDNSAVVFNQAADSAFNQVISGTGTVTKDNASNLTLAGNNTYGGDTTVTNGTVTFTGATNGLGGNIVDNAAVVFNQNANSSYNQVISGTGTVTKDGTGNLTLSGNNTYGGTTTVTGGTVTFTGSTSGLTGTMTNNSAVVFNQAADSAFNQVISGTGTLTKQNASNLTLAGNNTYTGDTTVTAGTLTFTGDTTALGGNIIDNAAVVFDQAANSAFNQVISGTGTVTKQNTGNLTLAGNNIYSGTTTVTGGTLTFTGSTSGLTGTMTNNSAVVFNQAANSAFNQVISGTGTITKDGASNLTLSANNTYTGVTTITNGTLTFTGDTSGLGGNIVNNAALVFNQIANSSYGQAISGTGTVTKTGTGSLTLSGNSTYSGLTTVTNGTLILTGNTSGITGAIVNNSHLVFNPVANTSFNRGISGTGDFVKNGATTLTLAGPNTWTGNTTINAGVLAAPLSSSTALTVNGGGSFRLTGNSTIGSLTGAGTVNLQAFTLTSGTNNASTTYTGVMSGTGGFTKTGSGTTTFTAANTYTGTTTINGGTLINNGSLQSPVSIGAGGTYQGTGSSRTVTNAGSIVPGNGIGSMVVNGNFEQTATGIFFAQIAPNNTSDLLSVTGSAAIAGALNIQTLGAAASFGNQSFVILTAPGGVTGSFASVIVPPNVHAFVRYFPTFIRLDINDLLLAPLVSQGNPGIIARYLDALVAAGSVSADLSDVLNVLGRVAASGPAALAAALNQISPDIYRELGFISFDQTNLARKAVHHQLQKIIDTYFVKLFAMNNFDPRLLYRYEKQRYANKHKNLQMSINQGNQRRKGLSNVFAVSGAEQIRINDLPCGQNVRIGKSNIWIEPYAQTQRKNNSNNLVGNKNHTYGSSVGGDIRVARNTYLGIMAGGMNSPFHWQQGRGNGHVVNYYGGLYALWLNKCGYYVDGQVTAGGTHYRSKRNINFSTINRTAKQKHKGYDISADLEAGYVFSIETFLLQPFFNAAYVYVHEGSINETGAGSLNIHRKGKNSQFARFELGGQCSYVYIWCDTLITPALKLSWVQKRPVGGGQKTTFTLQDQTLFATVFGDNKTRNQFSPGLSLITQFTNGAYVVADVNGEFGSGERTGQLMLTIGVTF